MDSKVVIKKKNLHDSSNILSKIFFLSSISLFIKGYRHGFSVSDLWKIRKRDLSEHLGDRLEEAWMKEVEKCRNTKDKPSLSKAIISCFWFEYMMCGCLVGILFIIVWPTIPFSLALFIEYFSGEKTPETYKKAHLYNFAMNLSTVITAIMVAHLHLLHGRTGMRVRIAACSVLYRKILRLNRIGLSKTESGQVINLMSNDVNRFDIAAIFLNYLWVMPIMVPVVSYLVWQHIGWATLSALAVIFLQTIVVQAYLSKLQGSLRAKIAKRTDERVRVMSELVNGVQVIKMYAWEKPFEKMVDKLRKHEVSYILRTSFIKGFSTALSVFTERFILLAAITTFILMGGEIRSGITFSLVQYYNLLQLACNILFPLALSSLAESRVSIKRIENFLCLEELEVEEDRVDQSSENAITNGEEKVKEYVKPMDLTLKHVSASWQPDHAVPTLKDISLTVRPGEFLGVTGLVGSGKSSLLQVILGEVKPSQGSLSLGGAQISYASQEPWLFVGTVRENILFGLPYHRLHYKKVVTACALVRDFELLPHGDSTLVGERGISLSGGQRARIGLARACYRKADIYLLDDPLSAVDTHVGKHLVSECVMGLLRHSTRILVTHQLHHLKSADKIIILQNGGLESQGTFDELSRTPLFEELMEVEESGQPEGTVKPQAAIPRTMSVQSHTSTHTAADAFEGEQQETEELMEEGKVSSTVYVKYFRAGGSWACLLVTLLAILLAQVVTSSGDLWLTYWMNIVEEGHIELATSNKTFENALPNNSTDTDNKIAAVAAAAVGLNTTGSVNSTTAAGSTQPLDHAYYIYIWAAAIFGCIILTTARSMQFFWVCTRSSIRLHNQMFSNIMSATMRFFDTNPSGRILNRFSKDMGVIDEILPKMYLDSIQIFMVMLGILVMVAIVSPLMLLTTLFCGAFMCLWTVVYLSTAQAVKRVEGVTRSPVFSHVTASLAGLSTVRACGARRLLRRQFDGKQDVHTAAWYLTLVTNATFMIWLGLASALYVVVVDYTFLLMDDGSTKSANVGLAISQALILVNMVNTGIRQATEVISQMTSVERVLQFTQLPQEARCGPAPARDWPPRARLQLRQLSLRYDAGAEPVLKDLNLVVESGWKVGVVGRTGAGKSSLISALFRLAPIDGHILIDDVDTADIALEHLRSKISIIPQEPVLFSASLRYNLDPFERYSDAEIWDALEQVGLKSSVSSLWSCVEAGGANLSAGQRQLLCLARAVLARNRLLVLDEATANVDPNTDTLIQKSIRKHFSNCTVLTVAHRLHTVADSDRVVVMEAGRIVECGHPHELLQNPEGHFSKMVDQLGAASGQSLRELAHDSYLHHISYVDTENPTTQI